MGTLGEGNYDQTVIGLKQRRGVQVEARLAGG